MSILAIGSVARTISTAPSDMAARRFSVLSTGSGHFSPRASSVSAALAAKNENPVDAIGRIGVVDGRQSGAASLGVAEHGGIGRGIAPAGKSLGEVRVAGARPEPGDAGGQAGRLVALGIGLCEALRLRIEARILGERAGPRGGAELVDHRQRSRPVEI